MSETIERPGWERAGVPHGGWTCVAMEDLDEPCFTCEMCKTAVVRYLHTMVHPEYPGPLRVGCVCAMNMSGDYVGPKRREDELRGVANRGKALLVHRREVAELIKTKRELKRKITVMGLVFRQIRDAVAWIDAGELMLARPGLSEWERSFISGMTERFMGDPCYIPTGRQTDCFVKLCNRMGVVLGQEEGW